MKRWVVLCLLMVPLLASADSFWEGNAALQRGDAAFENGLYAASNSFAPDTQLMVQNLENGRDWVPRIEAVMNHGNPGFQEALLPLLQQVPGRACGNLLITRGIGFFSSGHIQGVEHRDLG